MEPVTHSSPTLLQSAIDSLLVLTRVLDASGRAAVGPGLASTPNCLSPPMRVHGSRHRRNDLLWYRNRRWDVLGNTPTKVPSTSVSLTEQGAYDDSTSHARALSPRWRNTSETILTSNRLQALTSTQYQHLVFTMPL